MEGAEVEGGCVGDARGAEGGRVADGGGDELGGAEVTEGDGGSDRVEGEEAREGEEEGGGEEASAGEGNGSNSAHIRGGEGGADGEVASKKVLYESRKKSSQQQCMQ
ncbi:unnamed protein product [Closterium sp. NIES-65]|nr:unnamed protein product [Closterium sp. NIES-65]CAI5976574.1 unnamed protein product [Closterium sp. NIES-65]